ncbi:hypothetical protein [Streptomyces sp. RM72]|nr:hypothetical protein [Streptomyces sp. RM72]
MLARSAAVHAAQPTLDRRPDGAVVATVAPADYDGREAPVLDLNR